MGFGRGFVLLKVYLVIYIESRISEICSSWQSFPVWSNYLSNYKLKKLGELIIPEKNTLFIVDCEHFEEF